MSVSEGRSIRIYLSASKRRGTSHVAAIRPCGARGGGIGRDVVVRHHSSGRIGVNSYHHQAIKALADGMESMAFSDDGLVEAVCMPGKRFIVGLQWHPEFLYATDESSRKIVRAFVESMRLE